MMDKGFIFSQFRSVARLKGALALCLVLCALSVRASAQEPKITTFDAPSAGTGPAFITPQGFFYPQGTYAYGINDKGEIGGNFQDANNVLHGFLRTADGTVTAFDAPGAGTGGGQGTQGFAINSEGAIVGKTIDASYVQHGMLRTRDGAIIVFDAPGAGAGVTQGTFATNINSEGVIAGSYVDAKNVSHGFLRTPNSEFTTIDAPGAGTFPGQGTGVCAVDCINSEGAIVGFYTDPNNVPHGFLRSPAGDFTRIDVPGAGTGAFQGTGASGINTEGALVGGYTDASNVNHGFVRSPAGDFTPFDVPGDGTASNQGPLISGFAGINAQGVITGGYVDANNVNHGFVRTRDGEITTFDAPGAGTFQGTSPLGINSKGAITGYYIDANIVGHGFLRTVRPCAEDSQDRRENCEE